MLVYDVKSFEYIRTEKYLGNNVIMDDEGNFISDINSNESIDSTFSIRYFDKCLNIKKRMLIDKFKTGYTIDPMYRFYKNNGSVFYYPRFENKIYEVKSDTCVLVKQLLFGEKTMAPEHKILEMIENRSLVNFWMNSDDYVHSFEFFECNNIMLACYNTASQLYIGVSRDNSRGIFASVKSEYRHQYPFNVKGIWNGCFVSYIECAHLKECEECLKSGIVMNTCDNVDDEDMILVIWKVKNGMLE